MSKQTLTAVYQAANELGLHVRHVSNYTFFRFDDGDSDYTSEKGYLLSADESIRSVWSIYERSYYYLNDHDERKGNKTKLPEDTKFFTDLDDLIAHLEKVSGRKLIVEFKKEE